MHCTWMPTPHDATDIVLFPAVDQTTLYYRSILKKMQTQKLMYFSPCVVECHCLTSALPKTVGQHGDQALVTDETC